MNCSEPTGSHKSVRCFGRVRCYGLLMPCCLDNMNTLSAGDLGDTIMAQPPIEMAQKK